MLYREIIAVCSQIHTKHISTLYGQKVQLPNVCHSHWTLYKIQSRILYISRPAKCNTGPVQQLSCLFHVHNSSLHGHSGPEQSISDTGGKCIHKFCQTPPPSPPPKKNTGYNYRRNKNIKIGFKELKQKSLNCISVALHRLQWKGPVHSERSFGFYKI